MSDVTANREDLSIWSRDDIHVHNGSSWWSNSDLASLLSPPSASVSLEEKARILDSFLIEGSRVVEAVCRPYPVATTGTPIRLAFSIETAIMELDVRVIVGDGNGGESGREGVTEIYVPWVHYRSVPCSTVVRELTGGTAYESPVQEPNSIGREVAERLSASASERFLDIGEGMLALDVDMSEGTYEVKGQMLLWRYALVGDVGKEREKVVNIRIGRKGGAIPLIRSRASDK